MASNKVDVNSVVRGKVAQYGTTLIALSKATDIPYDTLQKSLGRKAERELKVTELIAICKYYGKTLTEFIGV